MRIGKIQNLREINVGTTQNNYFLQKKAAHFSMITIFNIYLLNVSP